ncbi:DUF4373 domain-containing protein [Elizabethkingia argentiflava]|uniref:DUF4373 domain-containing protein n=1 Tax=Elizabethkingia argenteiflava TaxID=2681556 RepID=A0A845PV76_9FLAO|nr:DUF4373 domain-containing protein [Elizabethkingia argenteiflava]NAW50387.1 DUF4373 domain-containing protein [Elizabethkingia argenteiflava]
MARTLKKGLDYFPLDTKIEADDKIQLIEAEFGLKGFGIIIKLFCKIYAEEGYYYKWTEVERLLFAKKIEESVGLVDEVIKRSVKWGLFDESVFNQFRILTSASIQQRFLEAASRRLQVTLIKEYSLINIEQYKNTINVNINSINVNIGTQSKVKYNNTNKYLFVSVKNLNESIASFSGNKSYFFLAYKFWKMWFMQYPKHKHLLKADVNEWVDTIRLIVEVDHQPKERLVGILEYFKKCSEKDTRFKDFWFKTIKSIKALRNSDKNGVKYIDLIVDQVNEMIEKQQDFNRHVWTTIEKFKKYESDKLSKKPV